MCKIIASIDDAVIFITIELVNYNYSELDCVKPKQIPHGGSA